MILHVFEFSKAAVYHSARPSSDINGAQRAGCMSRERVTWNQSPCLPLLMQLLAPLGVWAARALKSIRVSRNWSKRMETRLIIAYLLIAIMLALAVIGGIILSKRRAKSRQRDAGKGIY